MNSYVITIPEIILLNVIFISRIRTVTKSGNRVLVMNSESILADKTLSRPSYYLIGIFLWRV